MEKILFLKQFMEKLETNRAELAPVLFSFLFAFIPASGQSICLGPRKLLN
jgi:hypothetical protein